MSYSNADAFAVPVHVISAELKVMLFADTLGVGQVVGSSIFISSIDVAA